MLYLHLFSSFFHFRLYSTSRISDIAVPRFLLIIELLLHILKVVLLLKSHFLLLILPIAAGLYTTKESVSNTRSNIANSTSSG